MGKARLEVLGLEVPTGLFTVYHDDGFVDSIEDHSLELVDKYCHGRTSRKYNTERIKAFHDNVSKMGGCVDGVFMTFISFRRHIHTYYLKSLPYEPAVNVRAHEETHVLEELDHLDMLAEKILREQKVKIDFKGVDSRPIDWRELFGKMVDNREIRADIGAVFASYAHGIDPNLALLANINSYQIARDIYERSRVQGE